ncbi:LCP family protein [Gordonia sp. NPDC003425]
MSRWTPKPRGRKPGDDDSTGRRPSGSGADGASAGGSRPSRRAGREGAATDFTAMFGTPPANDVPAHGRLREPHTADRYVRGRNRMTVRELMEQMNAGAETAATPAATPPDGDSAPTEAIPRISESHRATESRDRGAASDRPTKRPTAPENANDVTQKIPTVGAAPAVDLSDAATTERVREESRAQESHAPEPPPAATAQSAATVEPAGTVEPGTPPASAVPAPAAAPTSAAPATAAASAGGPPLEPTPDLSRSLASAPRPRPRRVGGRNGDRSLKNSATVTGRVLVAIACVTALVGTGFVWGYLQSVNGNWRTINAVDPDDANIRNKDAQYGDENYLIVGTDTRSGKNSAVGAGTTADADGARSDTVILVNIPANRSRVVAVSFPRDLQVDRPDCEQWDNTTGTYSGTLPAAQGVKLNSVYADGGPKCLVKVITEMSGLNINHFIGMDFYGFEKVVRAVGGVEVCSTTPLYDYELGQILSKPGKQKLTGRRALNYVRARTISTEGNGDYGRIKRQQLFMSSLLRSTLSGNVLSNPAKLNSIVNTFIEYSYVDGVDTQSLLKLADSMQGIEAGRVTFLTIPTSGTATDGSNNEIPRTDDINAIFNAIIDDQPLPGEAAKKKASSSTSKQTSAAGDQTTAPANPSKVSATAQNPGNVGVRVLNGTGRGGQAAEVSDQLVAQGFDVRGVADASENRSDTVVRYGPGEQDSAATLAAMFPGATIQSDRTVKSGVEVILGSEFSGSVGTAPATGTTLSAEQLPPANNSSNLPNDLAVTNAGDTTCS